MERKQNSRTSTRGGSEETTAQVLSVFLRFSRQSDEAEAPPQSSWSSGVLARP